MNEQNINKNKIGARCLSDSEIELILPTYQRIYHQIEQFRKEKQYGNNSETQKKRNQNKDQQTKDQKTNNIGIIGVRGAGKSSVLKTIQVRLKKEKHDWALNDIILPLIISENMSESGTLMATILGMLSEIIREKDEKEKKSGNEDCIKKSSLRIKCDEAIKQYIYIQKEYRDILIQQYTTENDYVKSSATVFNSDTEFINKFNELIDELVNVEKQDGSLLFLFIDDIDLSTYRCADVVKTLLSYLSNENIVTFISGDLETFEEALTLDFLRQENVLNKDILEKKIGDEALLNSKKRLAYEYLKKIIPPAYRYNIKYWSLAEKGSYCVEPAVGDQANSESGAEQTAGVTLADLLSKALKGWVDPAFFAYAEIEDGTESDGQIENSNNKEKYRSRWAALPYTYHLFDNTSRGLNNIYNVLNEIVEDRKEDKKEDKKDYSKEKKLLLDTIVSSKPIYNKYRNDIQQNFFHIATKEDSIVHFDNARSVIYKRNLEEDQNVYYIEDPVERFSLFILVDFATRLLYENDYEKRIREDRFYKLLKEEAMKDFFFNPIIAEKVMDDAKYSWETKKETTMREEAAKERGQVYLALKDMNLKYINNSFLLKGDLVLNLAYYKNLSLDSMLRLYEDTETSGNGNQEMVITAELEQNTIIAIWKAFSSVAKVRGIKNISDIIAEYYAVFWMDFAYIRNNLSNSATQNIVIRLFENETNVKAGNDKIMQRILSNTLAHILEEQDMDEIKEEWQEIQWNNLYIVNKDMTDGEIDDGNKEINNMKKRIEILKIMDSEGLWQAEAAEDVVSYLGREVRKYLVFINKKLKEETSEDWKINTKDSDEAWQRFKNTNVGVSNTIARRTRNKVDDILRSCNASFSSGMSFDTYNEVIGEIQALAGNNRVWYGQSEAQNILNDMQKAFAYLDMQNKDHDEWFKKYSYFVFLLQCLYKYKIALLQKDNIVQEALLLADITKKLSVSHIEADRRTLEEFIGQLNDKLEDKIDSENFANLFSEGK